MFLYAKTAKGIFTPWNSGAASFLPSYKGPSGNLTIAVQCIISPCEEAEMALLDTGAAWSILNSDIAGDLVDQPSDRDIVITTRFGEYRFNLVRVEMRLLAEHGWGRDLIVEGVAGICGEWPGPTVLGYHGFLEKIRFGIDPATSPGGREAFYFGNSQ